MDLGGTLRIKGDGCPTVKRDPNTGEVELVFDVANHELILAFSRKTFDNITAKVGTLLVTGECPYNPEDRQRATKLDAEIYSDLSQQGRVSIVCDVDEFPDAPVLLIKKAGKNVLDIHLSREQVKQIAESTAKLADFFRLREGLQKPVTVTTPAKPATAGA